MATSVNCPIPIWLKPDNKSYRCRFCGNGLGSHLAFEGDRDESHQSWLKMHQTYNDCGWLDHLSVLDKGREKLMGLQWLKIRKRQDKEKRAALAKYGISYAPL